MLFDGKVILITGASSGIGAACAEFFAKEGAQLASVGRNAEKFKNVVKKNQGNRRKKRSACNSTGRIDGHTTNN